MAAELAQRRQQLAELYDESPLNISKNARNVIATVANSVQWVFPAPPQINIPQKMDFVRTTPEIPKYSMNATRYDFSSYVGRTRYFFDTFSPFLLTTTDKQLNDSKTLLQQFENGEVSADNPEMNKRLWEARKISDAIVHPQTGEKIPFVLRRSYFVPMCIPITLGMLSSTTIAGGLFWQWYNQSCNVAINYANGNKSNPLPPFKMAQAYGMAVAASCTLHFGLNHWLRNAKNLTPMARGILGTAVPFTAVAGAGALNLIFVRFNEMLDGIEVCDADGNVVGTSVKAGQRAVLQTAFTRVVLPAPVVLFPGLCMKYLETTALMKMHPRIRIPVNLGVVTAFLWLALPTACGFFPQRMSVDAKHLEPEYQNKGIQTYFYNRGL